MHSYLGSLDKNKVLYVMFIKARALVDQQKHIKCLSFPNIRFHAVIVHFKRYIH